MRHFARFITCDKRRQTMAKLITQNADDAPYQGTHTPLKS
jgi:hypothetical protein